VSARLTILRNAIAAQIRTVYTETDQVVIGSKTSPAVFPGWRVTMATGTSQPFTYGKREVSVGVVLLRAQVRSDDRLGVGESHRQLGVGRVGHDGPRAANLSGSEHQPLTESSKVNEADATAARERV